MYTHEGEERAKKRGKKAEVEEKQGIYIFSFKASVYIEENRGKIHCFIPLYLHHNIITFVSPPDCL